MQKAVTAIFSLFCIVCTLTVHKNDVQTDHLIETILNNSVPLHTTVHTKCYNFPEGNSEGPDIRGSGELGISDGLDGHPANGQPSRLSVLIDQILFLVKLAIEAKIGDLYNFICREEEVPAGDISVHHTNAGQVVLGGKHTS